MKRMDYETLSMEEIVVEMEDGFLGGSVDVKNPNADNRRIESHKVNTEFTGGDFSEDAWDSAPGQ